MHAFNKACQEAEEHEGQMPALKAGNTTLDGLEAKITPEYRLSREEIERKYKSLSDERLQNKVSVAQKLSRDTQLCARVPGKQQSIEEKAAELMQEVERRKASKQWLAQVRPPVAYENPGMSISVACLSLMAM